MTWNADLWNDYKYTDKEDELWSQTVWIQTSAFIFTKCMVASVPYSVKWK